jgi:hypothetical protein
VKALKVQRTFMKKLVFLILGLTFITNEIHADVIVSSLGSPQSLINFSSEAWAASPFQTDTQSWILSSVTVDLAPGGSDGSSSLYLFSDNAGAPDVALANLGSQVVTGDELYTYTPTDLTILNPSTIYWIAIGNTATNGGLNVSFSDLLNPSSFAFTGVSGASMSESVSSAIGSDGNPPLVWDGSGGGLALLFGIDGTPVAVPEPRQIALMILGGIFLLKRHFRNKSS